MRKKTLQAIRDHGVAAYPLECCGLVLKSGRREWYQPCRNTAASAEHFVMSAEDYAAAEESGDIVAVVHSHPDAPAAPSEADRVACEASGLPWYIVAVEKSENGDVVAGEIRGFAPEGYRAPLLGRQFAHGVLDCYTLVRDWYARERDIVLPDFSRDDGWWEPGKPGDLYMDHYAEAGFRPLRADETLGPGDVVLMQVRSDRANHAGVFLGDEPWPRPRPAPVAGRHAASPVRTRFRTRGVRRLLARIDPRSVALPRTSMIERIRTVRLYGWLGRAFGREHRLAVASPAEAVRALCALLPGFEKALADSDERGVRFACFAGRRNLAEDELGLPVGDDAIRIAPVLAGAKSGGLFQTILGAVLLAAATFTRAEWPRHSRPAPGSAPSPPWARP